MKSSTSKKTVRTAKASKLSNPFSREAKAEKRKTERDRKTAEMSAELKVRERNALAQENALEKHHEDLGKLKATKIPTQERKVSAAQRKLEAQERKLAAVKRKAQKMIDDAQRVVDLATRKRDNEKKKLDGMNKRVEKMTAAIPGRQKRVDGAFKRKNGLEDRIAKRTKAPKEFKLV